MKRFSFLIASATVSPTLEAAPPLTGGRLATARRPSILAAQTDSRSFTPTSFKLPIFKITLAEADGSNSQTLYTCEAGTAEGCLVDLADQTALDALAAKAATVSIASGDYQEIALSTCADGSSGSDTTIARITGSGEGPNNQTWTTDTTGLVTTDGTGTASETSVGNWGCATQLVKLPNAVSVAAGDAITLSISQLVRAGESTPEAGWRIIMVAAMSNLVFKTGTVAMLGSRALLGRIALSFGATIAVGVVLLLFV